MTFKILADDNIPLLEHFFHDVADVRVLPAEHISQQALQTADALLIRSKTRVNADLLQHAQLQFVGSCVSGMDHLDIDYLVKRQIPYYAAQGCNAEAVMQYVGRVVAHLAENGETCRRAAVVGVGHVGRRVVTWLQQRGIDVLQCDPVRAEAETDFPHTPLEQIQNIDLLCVHTPLTVSGKHPTDQLFDAAFFKRLKPGCVVINAGRGEVIDPAAIKRYAGQFTWVLDVWPQEPDIDPALVALAQLATPHIAGHTVLGKWLGTKLVYDQMARRFHWPDKALPDASEIVPHARLIDFAHGFKAEVLRQPEKAAAIFTAWRNRYPG